MIQPLRTAHRYIFIAFAFVLPAIVLVGLEARRPGPRSPAVAAGGRDSSHVITGPHVLWRRLAIRSQFYKDANHPREIFAALEPSEPLDGPDVLLYWVGNAANSSPDHGDALPPQAQLLGVFAPAKLFALPLDDERRGVLVLYSLAHQEVVDTGRVENLP